MSVLFASRNHQAIDAVEERLAAICGEQAAMTRARDADGERDLNFTGAAKAIVADASAPARDVSAALAKLDALAARRDAALAQAARRRSLNLDLSALADRLAALDLALPGTADAAPARGMLARLLGWLRARRRRPVVEGPPGPGATRAELEAAVARSQAALAALPAPETDDEAVSLADEIVTGMAALLPALLSARCAPTDEERQSLNVWLRDGELTGRRRPSDMAEDTARAVLRRRGVWAVSTLSAPSRIPPVLGLFDLVLFDEASQCDIASALPLFARARTAAVVGDPAQLGVIPSLGVGQDRELMRGLGLQRPGIGRYAQSLNSLFDLAAASTAARRTMLRDQFRSAPEIVAYINEAFYGLRLRTRVDTTRLRPPKGRSPGISWTDVRGPLVNETGRGCGSPAEAQAITERIGELARQGYDGEVGVVAPFQQQVMRIDRAVRAAVDPNAIERMKLKIATVDAFQGGERDVILFSLTGGADMPPGARRFLTADRRRFNVAISRARAVCDVFGDLAFARSSGVPHLERLAARSEPRPSSTPLSFDSPWEERLHRALVARGLEPHPQYEIAGRRLDLPKNPDQFAEHRRRENYAVRRRQLGLRHRRLGRVIAGKRATEEIRVGRDAHRRPDQPSAAITSISTSECAGPPSRASAPKTSPSGDRLADRSSTRPSGRTTASTFPPGSTPRCRRTSFLSVIYPFAVTVRTVMPASTWPSHSLQGMAPLLSRQANWFLHDVHRVLPEATSRGPGSGLRYGAARALPGATVSGNGAALRHPAERRRRGCRPRDERFHAPHRRPTEEAGRATARCGLVRRRSAARFARTADGRAVHGPLLWITRPRWPSGCRRTPSRNPCSR